MDLDRGIPPEPEKFGDLYDSTADIWIYSGSDSNFSLRHKLGLEFDDTPLKNPQLANDIKTQQDISSSITLIYITGFFKDDVDFAFYVKGVHNMTELSKGAMGKKCYQGPSFATPVIGFDLGEVFEEKGEEHTFETVSRTETKGIRWKYYYESAVAAWDKLEVDWPKFREYQEERARGIAEARAELMASNPALRSESELEETPSRSSGTQPEDFALSSGEELMDDDEGSEKGYDYDTGLPGEMESLDIESGSQMSR